MYILLFVHLFIGTMSFYVLGLVSVLYLCRVHIAMDVSMSSTLRFHLPTARSLKLNKEQYADTMAPDGLMRHCGTKRGVTLAEPITRARHATFPQGSLNNYHAGARRPRALHARSA